MNDVTNPTAGAIVIPEAATRAGATAFDDLDRAVDDLRARKDEWVRRPVADRVLLLEQTIRDTLAVADDWAAAGMGAKGLAPGGAWCGEEHATGPLMVVRHLRLLRDTLRDIERTGRVQLPGEPHARDDGRVVVPVFPTGRLDRLMFPGFRADVWMQPHVTLDTLRVGGVYRDDGEEPPGRVCFVLGAGNVSAVGPSDALHKLFAEDQVVVLKMNPVNEHLGEVVAAALRPLVREGYLRIVHGGAAAGQHLVHHPGVDTLHMTGSDKTHDAIVFGTGEEGARRKAAGEPLVTKPFTTELGNVTPVIVVPGPWSDADIAYQGKHLVQMVTQNAGFNCGCPRMVVQHAAWSRRTALLDAIRAELAAAPQRAPYYPGARDRWERFVEAHPDAETFGTTDGEEVPWTFLTGLDPAETDDIGFKVEAFNGVFGEVGLDAPRDVEAFLDQAVEWCNEVLWGTLTATILIHPRQLKDRGIAAALDRALSRLRYGSIGVNTWGATAYGLMSTTWGAFPGHPVTDIQSGTGVVHNTYFLEDPEKSVVRGPWRLGKKPAMAHDFSTMDSLARRLIRLEATGDLRQLPGVVVDGMRA